MSHYTRIKQSITRQSALVKALYAMGFSKDQVDVGESIAMKSWDGGKTGKHCQIRIKGHGWEGQNHVGGLANDSGWERQKDGTYVFHVDESCRMNKPAFKNKLMQYYGREVIKEVAQEQNFCIESETEENGELYIEVSSVF